MHDTLIAVAEAERLDTPDDPNVILARWVNEHPRFRLHRSRLAYAEGLTLAYADLFRRDLKLLNEVVTGGCFWPPDMTLDALARECRGHVQDQKTLVMMGLLAASSVRKCQLVAAERVLTDLTQTDAPPRQHYGPGIDVYECQTCAAEAPGDLPDCPRASPRDCDVMVRTVR